MKLSEVAQILHIDFEDRDAEVTGIITDSRTVGSGELFICLKGERFNGHHYAAQALASGAVAVVVMEDVELPRGAVCFRVPDTLAAYQALARAHRQAMGAHVLAITGSNGKTSTKDMLSACLAAKHRVVKTEDNFNNEIGLPKTLLNIRPDTEFAVVEMGMRGLGQIRNLCRVALPESGLITNVGPVHLELLGSLDNIANAKAELTEQLTARGFAVLNGDNEYVRRAADHTKAEVIWYGKQPENDYWADNIKITAAGTEFLCHEKCTGRVTSVRLPFLGEHNVYNALAALAMSACYGVENSLAAGALANTQLTEGRLQIVHKQGLVFLNDAYNASPASMQSALQTLMLLKQGMTTDKAKPRAVAVLADMLELGDVSEAAHREVGRWCKEYKLDNVFLYGQQAAYIYQEARKGGIPAQYAKNRADAVASLEHYVTAGDIILLKGSHSMQVDKVLESF